MTPPGLSSARCVSRDRRRSRCRGRRCPDRHPERRASDQWLQPGAGNPRLDRRGRSRPGSCCSQPLAVDPNTTLGDALMAPHSRFKADVLPLARAGMLTGMAHITGGGLIDNVPRMLPDGLSADFDPRRWEVPPIFTQLVQMGDVRRGGISPSLEHGNRIRRCDAGIEC